MPILILFSEIKLLDVFVRFFINGMNTIQERIYIRHISDSRSTTKYKEYLRYNNYVQSILQKILRLRKDCRLYYCNYSKDTAESAVIKRRLHYDKHFSTFFQTFAALDAVMRNNNQNYKIVFALFQVKTHVLVINCFQENRYYSPAVE